MIKSNLKMITTGILATGIFILTGCGSNNPTPSIPKTTQCQIDGAKAPIWVCNGGANVKGGIFAVGSAEKSPLGINFQRQEAMSEARDELTREISLKVKNMFKSYESSTGVKKAQTAEKVVTNVSKQLAYMTLKNSKSVAVWFSPKETMFVLVGIKGNLSNAVKQAVNTDFHNNQALWQEFKAKQAQKELDAEIDKEFKNK